MFTEMGDRQLVQLINSTDMMHHIEDVAIEAWAYRGSMFWRRVKGTEYLVKTTPVGQQTGLGPRTPENTHTVNEFMGRKAFLESRLKSLREASEFQRRLSKAARIGRAPGAFIQLLQAISRLRLEGPPEQADCLFVGTHALYAYEGRAGLRHQAEIDAGEPVRIISRVRGFEKALKGKLGKKADEIRIQVLHEHAELLDAPRLRSVAAGRSGHVARMDVIHPIALDLFCRPSCGRHCHPMMSSSCSTSTRLVRRNSTHEDPRLLRPAPGVAPLRAAPPGGAGRRCDRARR